MRENLRFGKVTAMKVTAFNERHYLTVSKMFGKSLMLSNKLSYLAKYSNCSLLCHLLIGFGVSMSTNELLTALSELTAKGVIKPVENNNCWVLGKHKKQEHNQMSQVKQISLMIKTKLIKQSRLNICTTRQLTPSYMCVI